MRAVRDIESGGPEVLRVTDEPEPEPTPGAVLIDVTAAGVNRADVLQRRLGDLLRVLDAFEGTQAVDLGPQARIALVFPLCTALALALLLVLLLRDHPQQSRASPL